MFKGLCMLILSEASTLLGSPETQKQIEKWAEEILALAVMELPPGKIRDMAAAGLAALQAHEGETPTVPVIVVAPVDPATLTDSEIIVDLVGGKS
jgi:hypothetical protein